MKKKLIIDPGHGGSDPGAVANNYFEKELCLSVSRRLAALLNADLTRTSDIALSSAQRTEKIRSNYEYCISVHFNAGGGTGTEAIHSIHSPKGAELGRMITAQISSKTGLPIRRVFSRKNDAGADYYFMHRLTGNTVTVIVECLFLDSAKDIQSLNIEAFTQAIAAGWNDFIDKKPEEEEVTVINLANMPILRVGNRGEEVKFLQQKLGITADGIFGAQTRSAVISFQGSAGIVADGIVGPATWSALDTPKTPTKTEAYTIGGTMIIETDPDNILPRIIKNALQNAGVYGLSGTFFWPVLPVSQQQVNGIMVAEGKVLGSAASHAWRGFPQSVLCYYTDGSLGIEKVMYPGQISKPVKWAVGGIGLTNWDPASEGFSGAYADVLRYVSSSEPGGHSSIGYKGDRVFLFYRTNCNRDATRRTALELLKLEGAIGLDSGGSAQIRHSRFVKTTTRRINNALTLKNL